MKSASEKRRTAARPQSSSYALRSVLLQGRRKWVWAALSVVLFIVVLIRTAWLADDAFITFRTVDNFIAGYGLRWNVAERVQAYTHPLWMLLVAGAYAMTREMYLTVLIVSMLVAVAGVVVIVTRVADHPLAGAVGIVVLTLSPAFMDFSTSGLETPLTHLLAVVFLWRFLSGSMDLRRFSELAFIAGLATLNRMDTILLYAPALGYGLHLLRNRRAVLLLAVGFAPFLIWELFSLIYYGFPFPNTAYAKLSTGLSRTEYLSSGFNYLRNWVTSDPAGALSVAWCLLWAERDRSPKVLAIAAGTLLYVMYVLSIGGDFMSGRMLSLVVLIAVAMATHSSLTLSLPRWAWAAPLIVIIVGLGGPRSPVFSGSDYGKKKLRNIDRHLIADERAFYFDTTGLVNGVPFRKKPVAEQLAPLADWARERREPLLVEGAVGFLGFRAGPGSHVLDVHALGDPLLARLPMVQNDPDLEKFCKWALRQPAEPCPINWRVGHYRRNVPDGYLDSLLSGTNQIEDYRSHELYEDIRLLTRAPLLDSARLRAIVRMNLTRKPEPQRQRVPFRPIPYVATYERQPETLSRIILSGAALEYAKRDERQKAISCFERMVELEKDNATLRTFFGRYLMRLGQEDRAESLLKSAIELRAGEDRPYLLLGQSMIQRNQEIKFFAYLDQQELAGDAVAAYVHENFWRLKNEMDVKNEVGLEFAPFE